MGIYSTQWVGCRLISIPKIYVDALGPAPEVSCQKYTCAKMNRPSLTQCSTLLALSAAGLVPELLIINMVGLVAAQRFYFTCII